MGSFNSETRPTHDLLAGGGMNPKQTPELSDANLSRIRIGMILLIVGTLFVLWAWGSWVCRASTANKPWATRPISNDEAGSRTNMP